MNPIDLMSSAPLVLAQEGSGQQGCGGSTQIIFMLAMFAVFWFILIRPQQKRAKETANMLNNLKKGDSVVTRGGVLGKISGVQDNVVTLEIQEKVRIRVLKSYIESKFEGPAPAAATTKGAAAKKISEADESAPAPTE